MKKKLFTMFAMIAIFLLLMSNANVIVKCDVSTSSLSQSVASFGQEAKSFSDLIENNTALSAISQRTGSPALLVISDSSQLNETQVSTIMKQAAFVVLINLQNLNVPTIDENITTDYGYLSNGTYQPGTSALTTLNPQYWVCVIQQEGVDPGVNYFMTLNATSDSCNTILNAAANLITMTLDSSNLSPSQTMQMVSNDESPLEESGWTPEYYYGTTVYFGTNGGDWFNYWSQIYEISQPDTNDKLEYWQVYSYIDHYLGADYEANPYVCGPYIYQQSVQVNAATPANEYDYGPTTTVSTEQISISLGLTLSSPPGFSAGVQWSETNPGIAIDCTGNGATSQNWLETFNGPNYYYGLTWPFYTPPGSFTYDQCDTQMAVIYDSPLGSGFAPGSVTDYWSMFVDDPAMYKPWGFLPGGELEYSYSTTLFWPNLSSMFDPVVTVLAYDESSGNYVTGIPIDVDGNWIASGSVADLSETNHLFQAPDADGGGAFNCFFDGSNYYGNGADIPISGDETITAYYNYIPTYTFTLNANDQYGTVYTDVYIDGNWVGYSPLQIQIPLGYHTISVDDPCGSDMFWGMYDQNYNSYTNGQSIPITGDTTITVNYLYW